jgi:hypothetical protein
MFGRKRTIVWLLVAAGIAVPAHSSPRSDLESAAKSGRVAFILIADPGTPGIDAARDLTRRAMERVTGSTLVELDRSDPGNAELVAKYRLAGAPLPLVLVAAANGAIAGGLPASQATEELLVDMIPSPKKAEILMALQEGKSVFLVAARKGMKAAPGAKNSCSMACMQMSGKSASVEIDMDDPGEAAFLDQLKVNRASEEPVTLVVNALGQVTATYAGAADVANLVQAAAKRAGGCCPSSVQGGSKSCGPGK